MFKKKIYYGELNSSGTMINIKVEQTKAQQSVLLHFFVLSLSMLNILSLQLLQTQCQFET